MNDQNQVNSKKKLLVIALSFVLLVIIVSAVYWYVNGRNNPEGDSLVIKNLGTYTQGKPSNKDTLNYIEHALYTTVNLNVDEPVKDKSIQDVMVRDGSFSQEYHNDKSIHTVKFIVDIESLKQSYDVSYQWSDTDKYSPNLDEWGTAVRCLPKDKLIYKDFDCKDMFSEMSTTADDPVLAKILPYEGNFYAIRYYSGDKEGNTIISVQIMTNTTGERTKKQFDIYKKEAQDWLISQGVNLNDYVLIYRNLSNDIVVD